MLFSCLLLVLAYATTAAAEINNYKLKVIVLHDLLREKCPEYSYQKVKQEAFKVSGDSNNYRQIYDIMSAQLEKCENPLKADISTKGTILPPTTKQPVTTPIQKTTKMTTKALSTFKRTTESIPTARTIPIIPDTTPDPGRTIDPALLSLYPIECLQATNFTQMWRRDAAGKNYKPGGYHSLSGYTCDLHNDLKWFRFAGAAGNRMLNSCPQDQSCGTYYPIWSDSKIPETVGVRKIVKAYMSYRGNCEAYTKYVEVMKCSSSDIIYRYTSPVADSKYRCRQAFCGMNL